MGFTSEDVKGNTRKQSPPDAKVVAAYADESLSEGWWWSRRRFPCRMLAPQKVEKDKLYPLVVFLHGAGARGTDNLQQLGNLPALMIRPEYRKRFPCFVLAPQCPHGINWFNYRMEHETQSQAVVLRLIEQVLKDFPIDPKRIYLTGFSLGGFGTWHLAAEHPEVFAAAVPVCGGGGVGDAHRLVELPLWAVHGTHDQVISCGESREMIEGIRKAGGNPRYTEPPNEGHSTDWAYTIENGVLNWMFEQKTHTARARPE
jgi:predicted peptidase